VLVTNHTDGRDGQVTDATTTESFVIPSRGAQGFRISAGDRMRVSTPKGQQVADFWAFNPEDIREHVSVVHTWVPIRRLKLQAGDALISNVGRRDMARLVEDGANGVHDLFCAPCDGARWVQLGQPPGYVGCCENAVRVLTELGYDVIAPPPSINWFMHSTVGAGGSFELPPNPVAPGAYVVIEALTDLLCVISACPHDIHEPMVNAPDGPTEIAVEVLAKRMPSAG
jgi:uncharacterized protein YcgI (DUF1989 family)